MESRSILFLEKFCVSDSSCRISTVSEFFCHHCFFCVSPICLIPPVESSGRAARNCTLKCSVATRPIFSFSFLLYHLSDLRTSHGHLVASFYSFRFGALVSVQQVDCCLACQFGHVQFDTFLDPPVWLWRPVDFPFCVNVVRFISIHFPPYSDLRLSFSLFLILGLCSFAIFLSHGLTCGGLASIMFCLWLWAYFRYLYFPQFCELQQTPVISSFSLLFFSVSASCHFGLLSFFQVAAAASRCPIFHMSFAMVCVQFCLFHLSDLRRSPVDFHFFWGIRRNFFPDISYFIGPTCS